MIIKTLFAFLGILALCLSVEARNPNTNDLADRYKTANGINDDLAPPFATLSDALVNKVGTTVFDANHPSTAIAAINTVSTAQPSVTPSAYTFNAVGKNETMYLTSTGTVAAATVTFPTDANSQLGQVLRLVCTNTVTALTVSSSGLTLKGTAVTALVANTPVSWQKVAAATWMRLN